MNLADDGYNSLTFACYDGEEWGCADAVQDCEELRFSAEGTVVVWL